MVRAFLESSDHIRKAVVMLTVVGLALLASVAAAILMFSVFKLRSFRHCSHWSVAEIRGFILRSLAKEDAGMAKHELWHLLRDSNHKKAVEMVQFLAVFTELFDEGSIRVGDNSGKMPRYVLSENLRADGFALGCEEIRRTAADH